MSEYNGIQFSDSDVVNKDDYIPNGEYNPHNVRPWLLHDHGFVVAIVFADCEQNALDNAADVGKMDHYTVTPDTYNDYADTYNDYGGQKQAWEKCAYLGNAGELFDIDTLGIIELPNPKFSFCALFDTRK